MSRTAALRAMRRSARAAGFPVHSATVRTADDEYELDLVAKTLEWTFVVSEGDAWSADGACWVDVDQREVTYVTQKVVVCDGDDDAERIFRGLRAWMVGTHNGEYAEMEWRSDDDLVRRLSRIDAASGGTLVVTRMSRENIERLMAKIGLLHEDSLVDFSDSAAIGYRIGNIVYFGRAQSAFRTDGGRSKLISMATIFAAAMSKGTTSS